jgi:hypothetical protein
VGDLGVDQLSPSHFVAILKLAEVVDYANLFNPANDSKTMPVSAGWKKYSILQ